MAGNLRANTRAGSRDEFRTKHMKPFFARRNDIWSGTLNATNGRR
jgi:hypothetical protein